MPRAGGRTIPPCGLTTDARAALEAAARAVKQI